MVSPADWKAEASSAVEHWLALEPGSRKEPRWKCLGPAQEGNEPGWLVLDKRGSTVRAEALNDLCFASKEGPDRATVYPIELFRQVDEVVLLKEPPALPLPSRIVWTRNTSPRMLLEKLRDGLRNAGRTPLADAFAAGTPATGSTRGIPTPPALLGSQAAAYRACLAPGVRLVWGPPGTGKTRVLAHAIEALITAGKRVLLVSTANIAVDNALAAVVAATRPRPGTAIRVGPAQLAEVANNPDVHLQQLAAKASVDTDHAIRAAEQRLAELAAVDAEVAALSDQLVGFDIAQYQTALARIDNERRLRRATVELSEAEQLCEEASNHANVAHAALRQAENEWERIADAREALSRARELTGQLRQLELEQLDRQSAVATAELRLASAKGWRAVRKAKHARDTATEALRAFERIVVGQRRRLSEMVAVFRASAHPVTEEYVTTVGNEVTRTRAAATRADHTQASARERLRQQREFIRSVTEGGTATDADHALVQAALATGLPEKWEQRKRLTAQLRQLATERGELESSHRRLVDTSRKLRRDAERVLIEEAGLVATTLARSRLHPALADATFDVVLVDEAGAANLAEVLLVLCRATTTAALFGDFLQLPPVRRSELRTSTRRDVQRWILPDPFAHVGIRTPDDAIRHPGCVALLHQFRYGPSLRRLANDVIYEVLRDAGELPSVTTRHSTEIILIDTSGLGELGTVHQSNGKRGWWPAGLVLSRALAEHHLPEDTDVGIVTPYTQQRDATLAGLRDRGLVTGVSVGTVHAFQGREFPTVVFDLVEDGAGWVAGSRRGSGSDKESGVRLFGVGITRAKQRLYLIADRRALRTATQGPLAALTEARRRGHVRLWSGAALLGLAEPEPQQSDIAYAEVSEMLKQLVTATDINDEKTFYSELERRLRAATRRVWMWSPWISTRARHVVPLIQQTVDRGVDVRVFLRPDDDHNMAKDWAQRELPGLYESGATVIRSQHEHRKIVVIDERIVLLGSLNVLSSSVRNTTREQMVTLEGHEFAQRMLAYLRARDFGTPLPCGRCSRQCELRRASGKAQAWFWYCASCRRREPVPERA